jgi:hypothetical protein
VGHDSTVFLIMYSVPFRSFPLENKTNASPPQNSFYAARLAVHQSIASNRWGHLSFGDYFAMLSARGTFWHPVVGWLVNRRGCGGKLYWPIPNINLLLTNSVELSALSFSALRTGRGPTPPKQCFCFWYSLLLEWTPRHNAAGNIK